MTHRIEPRQTSAGDVHTMSQPSFARLTLAEVRDLAADLRRLLHYLLTLRWRWRRVAAVDVEYAAAGDVGWIIAHRGRWRRPVMIEAPREDWLELTEDVVDGEVADYIRDGSRP